MSQAPPLKVLYTGAFKDLSGYAAAARDYVYALDAVNIDVAANPVSFEPWAPKQISETIITRRFHSLLSKPHDAPLHIIHLTPDNYKQFKDDPRYKIGYFAWETSRLPASWVGCLNQFVQEVWVPCERLGQVCRESGVDIPIFILPHAVTRSEDRGMSCTFPGIPEDPYKFYSIFQWSERKNPLGLLRSYYEEFSKEDNVCLILKTYRVGNSSSERDFIRKEISTIRREIKGAQAPPVVLIEDFLTTKDLQCLHEISDCYISMARSEGFGLGAFEAALAGNPVIVPNNWGFADHFTNDTGWLVDVPHEVPVANMRHISILYTGDMTWGDPDINVCKKAMREAFSSQEETQKRGKTAQTYVDTKLSHVSIGRMMKYRLEQIHKELFPDG